MELELNDLEAPDELKIDTVSEHAENTKSGRLKPLLYHCWRTGDYRNQCRLLKRQKEYVGGAQTNPGNRDSGANNFIPNNNNNNNDKNNDNNKKQ